MATSKNFDTANIGNYSEGVNANNELVLSGVYKGVTVGQTIPCEVPCALFIDPVSKNFFVTHNLHEVSPELEFVKLIREIS